jgi:multiple sugar transport system permease protein
MASGIRQLKRQDAIAGWLFMTPALIIISIFIIIPIIFAITYSFTNWNGISPPNQASNVGLANYENVLFGGGIRQADFFRALKNTTYFSLGVVPLQTALALLFAVIVNQRRLRFKGFFRTAYYVPAITSSIAISLIFMLLYLRDGVINRMFEFFSLGAWDPVPWLSDARGLLHIFFGAVGLNVDTAPAWFQARFAGMSIWDWLSGPSVALFAIMLMNTWTTIGTMMIVFLAALQDIPPSVYEAAAVDGATQRQVFRKITLPLLRPTTFFVVTLGLIGTYQVFDQIYVMSSGGPAKTTLTVAYLVYRAGFNNSEMGVGATIAILLFIIIFILTMIQRRITAGAEE